MLIIHNLKGTYACLPIVYLVCLLGRRAVFLGVLVGFEQQVGETGDRSCVPEGSLVLWAQGQVTDQADHSLEGGSKDTIMILFAASSQQAQQGGESLSRLSVAFLLF